MNHVVSISAAAALLSASCVLAGDLTAVAQDSSVVGPYAGHRLVRVWPVTVKERLAVAQLPLELMSEAVRRDGGTEYLATGNELALLDAAGVEYEVLVENMQARVDSERARLDARARWGVDPQPRGDDTFFQEFRDIDELNTFYDGLVAAHPGLISRETIGQSIQSRDIEAFTIGAPGDVDSRPSLIFNGTAHAREWISPMTVTYIMRGLVEGYGNDPRITELLDNVTFRIAPIMNPDGYVYSWGPERFWRKNRRNNGNGTFGVDWNRNFGTGWGGSGASGDSGDDTYYGTAPFSEPETQALRDYVLSVPNRAFHIDFHAFSQLVLYPWGYTETPIPQPDLGIQQGLANVYAGDISSLTGAQYAPIPGNQLYIASGISSDWTYDQGDVFSFTVELRPSDGGLGGFDPSPTQILPCAQENFEAVLGLAESVAVGVIASFPGGQPAVVEPGVSSDVSIEIVPAFSGPLDGSSAMLWTRVGDSGPFAPGAMSVNGDVYTGSLPSASCGSTIEYYVSVDSTGGATYEIPIGGADSAFTVGVLESTVAAEDDMETDTGWAVGAPGDSATTGVWERVDPQGTDAQPENDHTTGGTDCWVTDGDAGTSVGSFDIDGGVTTLTSPVLDASGDGDAFVSFWLWYSNDQGASPNADSMPIRVSDDGGATWSLLDEISASTNAWVFKQYLLTDATDQLRLRFEASDLGDGSIVEAAVDDLRVELVGCSGNPADIAPPFGVLDLADVQAFVAGFLGQDPIADLAPPFGVFDLSDVQLFVDAFVNGVP